MKKIFLLLVINVITHFIAPYSAKAQTQKLIDSLSNVLKKQSPNDIAYGRTLVSLAHAAENVDSCSVYSDRLIVCVQQQLKTNPKNVAMAELQELLAEGYTQKATALAYQNDDKKVIEYIEKSQKIAQKYRFTNIEALNYLTLGAVMFNQGETDNAFKYYRNALGLFTETNNQEKMGNTLSNIANTFSQIDQHDSAFYYNKKALEVRTKANHKEGIAVSLSNIGTYYLRQKKNYDAALSYFLQSTAIDEKNNFTNGLPSTYALIARVYMLKKQPAKAVEYAKKSFDISNLLKYPDYIYRSSEMLSSAYESNGDYKNALAIYKTHILMRDSVKNQEKQAAALKADFKHENDKKQAEIKVLEQENHIKSLQTWGLLAGLIGVGLIAYFAFTRFKARKAIELQRIEHEANENRRRIELEKMESELIALKAQMNPHFIFNALNSIQELYLLGDKRLANEQMGNFATLTREILNISNLKTIPLQREIMILENYLQLESVRFEGNFNYKIQLQPEYLDATQLAFPPMLIQPYVENAIKHGLLHKKGDKKLTIVFTVEEAAEAYLIVTIADNGIGRARSAELNKKREPHHQSFSTSATQKRLELLNTGRSAPIKVAFNDLIEGTEVIVRIPIEIIS